MQIARTNPMGVIASVWQEAEAKAGKNRPVEAGNDLSMSSSPANENAESVDPECIRRAQNGDSSAAEDLIIRVHPQVLRIVRRYLARRDSEEDVVQEILIKVVSRLSTFEGTAPFEHWVARIAVNTCLNRLRAEKARPEWRWADLSEDQADALDAVTAGTELQPGQEFSIRDLVEHLLECLSPEDRLVVRLLEMDELSVKEICARTGWSSTLVRIRAFRARHKLNQKFAEKWKKGEL
jgi:RNA polymerase sigma factor (sigma-70 family)